MNRKDRRLRTSAVEYITREDGGNPCIEGYFAVFNSNYEIWPGATESIDNHAFDSQLHGDVRALINHDTTLVLGRTTAGSLQLRVDEHGLWGHVDINPNDTDAMNIYERVKRGDVDQCSFGFEITEEETDYREDGSIHWTIKGVKLYEVSVCTFPAYDETSVSARKDDYATVKERRLDAWREAMTKRIKEGNHES